MMFLWVDIHKFCAQQCPGKNENRGEIWFGSDEDGTYITLHRMIVITMHSFWPAIILTAIAHQSVPDKIYCMVKTIHSGPFIIVCTDSLAENVNSLVPNEMIKILKFCMFSVTFFSDKDAFVFFKHQFKLAFPGSHWVNSLAPERF